MKVTVSIPDALHEKMQQHKATLNYSKIFQEAVSTAIASKERLKKNIHEEIDMESVIERLRQEKKEIMEDYYEQGKAEGIFFAKNVSFTELEHAGTEVDLKYLISSSRFRNDLLGDYFTDYCRDSPFSETSLVPFMRGWLEAVKTFWNEVSKKI